ncbi:hypothetical protein C8R47DRAFT_1298993 [Mycena vitilis]|nr:hypothetical protein C8R47DRAFT_1298993 [Mycena vitilis]
MSTTKTVPLSALATSVEDTDIRKLEKRYLFPTENVTLHRHMEYLWGLEIGTIDPTHKRSILKFRKSMTDFPTGSGWTLVPTEETLAAMDALQVHNFTVPISERKSFLTEFPAKKYEYIFVPLRTEVDFFILKPGRAPQRLSAPYTDFPLVTSTANPFFATFYSRPKLQRYQAPSSETWYRLFCPIKIQWSPFPLPEDFLLSYPATHPSGSDETVVTPADEDPDKDVYICKWVQQTNQLHDPIKPPPLPPTPRSHRRRNQHKIIPYPRWQTESKRGKAFSERLVKPPHDVRHSISH